MEGKRKTRVRRTVTPTEVPIAPGTPAKLMVDAGAIMDLVGKVGELTGEVRGIHKRLDRLETAVERNEEAIGGVKQEVSALSVTVSRLAKDKDTPPPGGASGGRADDLPTAISKWGDLIEKWGPKILKVGGAVLAALLSWWATVWARGGHSQP